MDFPPLLRLLGVTALALLIPVAARGAEPEPAQPKASFTIRADWFNRGNVRVSQPGENYADKYPCIWNAGNLPNQSEYDIEFPVTADYTFVALYTAQNSRPVDIYLDGRKIHQGFAGVTGSWQTSHAQWEPQCTVHVTEGKHTIKLLCPGPCMPHICAFRLESPVPFPPDWSLCRQTVQEQTQAAEPGEGAGFVCGYPREPPPVYDYHQPFKRIPPPTPRAHRILEYLLIGGGKYQVQADVVKAGADLEGSAANNELLQERDVSMERTPWVARLSVKIDDQRTETDTLNLSPEHLRKMLRHAVALVDDFRTMQGAPPDFLEPERARAAAMLDQLEPLMAEPDGPPKWQPFYEMYVAAYRLKNRVALENPLLDFDKLLLAKRLTYDTSHIYTTYFDGSHRYKAGSGLFVLSPVGPNGKLANLTGELKTDAIYRDPDLAFDARSVLFSYKPDLATPCRIYEVGIDGGGLRQLTDTEYDDVDPCYLPDGRVMFVSTRCRRVTLCHNAFTVSVLYTMNRDGSAVRCISPNTVHDFKPSVMPDGQVTFTRWEYVDKHLGNQQSLWITNPDGTRMTHVAGNHFGPLTYWEPFRVPQSRLIVCILAPHMPLACGPVALVDPANTYASPAIFENVTPELPPPVHFGWLRTDVGYYTYAYPLSENYFIVSYCYGPDDRDPTGYGIYLLDRWNNRDLIYRDPELGAFEPVPVRPRPVPPRVVPRAVQSGPEPGAIDAETDPDLPTGVFYVTDVYQGLPGVKPGEVKYLRVIEEIPKPVSADCPGFAIQYPVISNRGHLALKRLWGTVPVEPDGSAHFKAPANKALYFAALDKNFMEIQRMRSFTMVAPGEQFGCVGCHEPKHSSPGNLMAAALRRAPSEITPPPDGGVHGPDFHYDVQPVLDKHCAECHTGAKPKGGIDLSPDYTDLFNVAYETLTGKDLVKYVCDYSCASLPTRPPEFYGSHASKVVETLLTTHLKEKRVNMPPEDFRRLVTWIDCNCPYYGTYTFTRPGTVGGRELFAPYRAALDDVYKRRCQSCHEGGPDAILLRVRLPEVEKTRGLAAPLARADGGDGSCTPAVFTDQTDPDFQKLAAIYHQIKSDAESNPRVDMLEERPRLLDPECRYVYRP
jgi:hypothetical protein